MALAKRINGHELASHIADVRTGEIIAEAGEVLSLEKAQLIERSGVNELLIKSYDGKIVKVFPTVWSGLRTLSTASRKSSV
jgi:DNA-directed RNA polymerase subunit beta